QRGVNHDSYRVAPAFEPAGEPGIVGDNGSGADHHRVAFVAPSMDKFARLLRADPSDWIRRRDTPVKRHRQFKQHERTPLGYRRDESFVELPALLLHQAHFDRDSGPPQFGRAASPDGRIRVEAPDYGPLDAALDQRVGARRRMPEMSAG